MSDVKERGILFSTPMVRALLEGSKTQTRRIVTEKALNVRIEDGLVLHDYEDGTYQLPCPFGVAGDRLWVRETFLPLRQTSQLCDISEATYVCYLDGGQKFKNGEYCPQPASLGTPNANSWPRGSKWRPSIHLPRWASRITLEITAVQLEHLQDITPEGAIAEGCCPKGGNEWDKPEVYRAAAEKVGGPYPRGVFAMLWDKINGPGSWKKNPWVWVVSFKRIKETA